MSPLFERLHRLRYEAMARNEKLLCWRINEAALMALTSDEGVAREDNRLPLLDRPLLGLPIELDEVDRSDDVAITLRSSKPTDLRKLFPATE